MTFTSEFRETQGTPASTMLRRWSAPQEISPRLQNHHCRAAREFPVKLSKSLNGVTARTWSRKPQVRREESGRVECLLLRGCDQQLSSTWPRELKRGREGGGGWGWWMNEVVRVGRRTGRGEEGWEWSRGSVHGCLVLSLNSRASRQKESQWGVTSR